MLRYRKKALFLLSGRHGRMLKDVPSYLQDDKEIVLAAMRSCADALKYASDRLRDDKDFVLASFNRQYEGESRHRSLFYDYYQEGIFDEDASLLDDRSFVLAAASKAHWIFPHANKCFRDDK